MEKDIFLLGLNLPDFLLYILPTPFFLISGIILLIVSKKINNINLLSISKALFFCSIPAISTLAAMFLILMCVFIPVMYLLLVLPTRFFERQ